MDGKTAIVEFKERDVNIDLRMPDGKRFKLDLPLFQPIEPVGSSFEVLGTKVEITMKKANGISWATLEPSEGAKCWTTFGTTGGAGTGKQNLIGTKKQQQQQQPKTQLWHKTD